MQICYCGNAKVFSLILYSLLSIAKYSNRQTVVYLITMDLRMINPLFAPITERQRQIGEEALRRGNSANRVVIKDATEEYKKYLMGGKNENGYYTPYAQARLLASELGLPDKLIYLDADVMCCDDIRKLWEIDVTGYELAAVKDRVGSVFIRPTYFNSGVLLMNMNEIRSSKLFGRVRNYVKNHRMIMPDQTALNLKCKRKKLLPRRFNEQRAIGDDTVIKHFCRGFKWYGPLFRIYNYKQSDRDSVHNQLNTTIFDDIYEQYDQILAKYGEI